MMCHPAAYLGHSIKLPCMEINQIAQTHTYTYVIYDTPAIINNLNIFLISFETIIFFPSSQRQADS